MYDQSFRLAVTSRHATSRHATSRHVTSCHVTRTSLILNSFPIDERLRNHKMYVAVPAKDAIRTLTRSLTDAGVEIESHRASRDSLTYSINCKISGAIAEVTYIGVGFDSSSVRLILLTHDWSVVVDDIVYVMDALNGAWIGAFLSVDDKEVSAAWHMGVLAEAPTISTESQSQS